MGRFGIEAKGNVLAAGEGSTGGFDAHPGTPVPSAPMLITPEGKHSKDSWFHNRVDRSRRPKVVLSAETVEKVQTTVFIDFYIQ